MAQGAVAPVPTNGASLTAEELREILEYERIIQFRDAVLAGTHPRVKIPSHLAGKQLNAARHVSSPSLSKPRANNVPPQPARSTPGSFYEESSPTYNKTPNNPRAAGMHLPMSAKSAKSEINPILLEKSDDLIKAEIQLQRQRLERALREQIEQQRLSQKALLQTSESLPNFDLSEVLTNALAIVHPSTTAEAEPSVGAHSSASDSFDENTFYSSQHDTPEPSSSSQGQKEPGEIKSHSVISVDKRSAPIHSSQNQVRDRDKVMTSASLSNDNHLAAQAHLQTHIPPSQNHSQNHSQMEFGKSLNLGGSGTRKSRGRSMDDLPTNMGGYRPVSTHQNSSTELDNMTSQQIVDRMAVQKATEDLLAQAFANDSASPLIRAHNLSPIAPQPARVSPLATAREPPVLREAIPVGEPPPAQVAALRNKPSGVSSTDSSPSKGTKGSGKKEKKKKKRKTKDNADTPDSPYIKPEPRSPSPFAVAPLPRPPKRQRQSGQYAGELNYDEPRYDPEDDERASERYKELREPRVYGDRYDPELRRPEPSYQRLEHDEGEYRRVSGGQYARRPQSPAVYSVPYLPSEVRPVRAASHAMVDRRIHEEPRYYRDNLPRASVRPDAGRERSRSPVLRERRSPIPMAPPRQPVRIVIDAYGREYIDPTPTTSMRQSMAPPSRYRDPEVVYERAPVRTVSGRVPVEAYEEEGVIYRRSSPSAALPRRVITQPEYAPPEYRSYRQREYSVRPMANPGEEYVQIRGAPERRQITHLEDAPREHAPRATSVRPEPVRYEIPREYVGRLQSVRPEPPTREYAASARPEPRHEVLQVPQAEREYSVRPADIIPRREHVPATEGARYYDELPSRRPAEVAFIERPRAREASVLVYADDVRREVYR